MPDTFYNNPPIPHQIFARRAGRLAFGAVLLAGVIALVVAACTGSLARGSASRVHAAPLIGATWPAAAIAGAITWAIVDRLRPRLRPGALFVASVMLPAASVALLAPLTLHLGVALMTGGLPGFDEWVLISMAVTAPAHVVLAAMSMGRAQQLASGTPAWTVRRIYVTTVVTSCVPFVLLLGIPPALVAITGLPLLPLIYAMAPRIDHERAELAELALLPGPLPRAALVTRRS